MIRVLNFFCVALMGLSILALYHVSERTRLAGRRSRTTSISRSRPGAHADQRASRPNGNSVASPAKIATLAASKLGLDNTATVQLSSLELLPRRGEDSAPLTSSPVRRASVQIPAQSGLIQQIAARSGTQ